MNKTILLLLTIFTFCSISAQNKNDISNYNSEKTIISTTELASGIHVLKLQKDKNFEFKKIIKQ